MEPGMPRRLPIHPLNECLWVRLLPSLPLSLPPAPRPQALIFRDARLLWLISIGFEVAERSLLHLLPNFVECWWVYTGWRQGARVSLSPPHSIH